MVPTRRSYFQNSTVSLPRPSSLTSGGERLPCAMATALMSLVDTLPSATEPPGSVFSVLHQKTTLFDNWRLSDLTRSCITPLSRLCIGPVSMYFSRSSSSRMRSLVVSASNFLESVTFMKSLSSSWYASRMRRFSPSVSPSSFSFSHRSSCDHCHQVQVMGLLVSPRRVHVVVPTPRKIHRSSSENSPPMHQGGASGRASKSDSL
mmetsp:Transcript_54618/g.144315  ORF Transcript_54618/g.144315 Transcript_54618/m.144315 type:complete len:205 (-) Transcript_54618:1200-1814(-)